MNMKEAKIIHALRNVDNQDLNWLISYLNYSGHGIFWKEVCKELKKAIRS